MIANTQNCQFLSCKWPQYHFSMLFIMVYINSCSLLVCQIDIYWDSTHIDVNWRPFNVENDRKWSKIHKIVNFCHVNDHNTTFQWFLWWFISISAVCYCVRWISIEIAFKLTSIDVNLMSKWSKIRKIVNFCHVNGHNIIFQWFLRWFISIPAVC